jgi:hypothetical protein
VNVADKSTLAGLKTTNVDVSAIGTVSVADKSTLAGLKTTNVDVSAIWTVKSTLDVRPPG